MAKVTEGMLGRVLKDWEDTAGEPVQVEEVKGTVYGYCSELGCLRLFYKYRHTAAKDKFRLGHSKNLGTWFVALDLDL